MCLILPIRAWPRTAGTIFSMAVLGISSSSAWSADLNAVQASAADAVRFLEQSGFGPTAASVSTVQQLGVAAYLDDQFNQPATAYAGYKFVADPAPPGCDNQATSSPEAKQCYRDNYTLFPIQRRFYQNAVSAPDQLRQRVAFALSQILVVSGSEISKAYAMAGYQNILIYNAFGNYRDILYEITLSPAMGRYLDMVNNDKPDPARGIEPNENYARELLQLFSIGVYKLNQDGTVQTGAGGAPLPSYDQDTVEGFAHVFTGWTYPTKPGGTLQRHNPVNYEGRMQAFAANHATGTKQLLDGRLLPAGQSADRDLNDAIDNIFNHPNVGPFIGKQLIQKLVTSNPSPAYVSRVAAAFNNNGSGVRGDMKAVVRAILLDAEARGDAKIDASYGKLREPALFLAGIVRALDGQSDGVYLRTQSQAMGQDIYNAPSVFNFYPPDYPVPNSSLLGPEFGIQSSTTAVNRLSFANNLIFSNGIAADPSVNGATGTTLNLTGLQALAGDPMRLVQQLNRLFMHDTLSSSSAGTIASAVQVISANDPVNRARTAAFLMAASAQYQVER